MIYLGDVFIPRSKIEYVKIERTAQRLSIVTKVAPITVYTQLDLLQHIYDHIRYVCEDTIDSWELESEYIELISVSD